MTPRRLGGIIGPAAFIGAWALLGARTRGYSPVDDPISRLAAIDAPTRAAMTAGFLAYAIGVGAHSTELRRALPGPAATAAAVNVVGTVGIAVTPLGSAMGGAPHAVAAALAYGSLAATPLLAVRPLAARGDRAAARGSAIVGTTCGACLALSAVVGSHTGLWQRLGLTIGHAWLIASAMVIRPGDHPVTTQAYNAEGPGR